ncbi:hypothetical protein [Flammeovirga sp. SJP92]|uniref:hypothetical protein n=1 Tax=Flammeovirga sp. SJP92 TaxID=1775430 RepID=UPI0007897D4C|nr:hypothetical protein [Flammeovirga sp. SJP92]KXX72229.1 hypothetical protein AVL50_01105 [Flammeovirga sp. SJP92]
MKKNKVNNKAIVSYPKTPAFFALGLFVFILITITIGTVRWMNLGGFEWYKLLLLLSTSFITLFMFVRIMFIYKTVTFKGNIVTEKYPLRIGSSFETDLTQYLLFWEVKQKAVGKKQFDVLVLQTKIGQPIIISNREMTNFTEIVKFMDSKFKKYHVSKVK